VRHADAVISAPSGQLVVFSGRPGVGKTKLARAVADKLDATFLRIDTIEAAIVSTLMPFRDNPVGYVVAGWVAADQLRAGRWVVADAVNNVEPARDGWARVADECEVRLRFVEDQRRVERRTADWPGQGVPTWEQVQRRPWQPFRQPRLLIDNVGDPAAHTARVIDWLLSARG
jgi:predicted kinase